MKTRIISAAVAVVLAVVVFILHKTIVLEIVVALLTAGLLFEIFKATQCNKHWITMSLCCLYGMVVPFSRFIGAKFSVITLVFWLLVFASFLKEHKNMKIDKLGIMIASTTLITFSMNSLLTLHKFTATHGLFLLILTLCGAWLADSGAYFAGTFFGKTKLCPTISPKKTVEGLVGGTITNGLIFLILALVYNKIDGVEFNYIYLFILGMACSIIGLLGDLTASLIKRQYNIKDYGNIMPGHGGIMDRFDSVLFVAPFMAIMITNFSIFK
ncbi:MAG: phosphatidate cytidylyltransferase [Clostridiales bacterium]|nr:phosphatidate cytidylyltransferase [Clostridiales bacterium]